MGPTRTDAKPWLSCPVRYRVASLFSRLALLCDVAYWLSCSTTAL